MLGIFEVLCFDKYHNVSLMSIISEDVRDNGKWLYVDRHRLIKTH